MVYDQYQKILNAITQKNEDYFKNIGFLFEWEYFEKLKSYQYNVDIMKSYQHYHDCGKHISKKIDEKGKIHYPNHAQHSSELYEQYFDNKIAKELILKDLNFHSFKNDQIVEWIKVENKNTLASLYLTSWSELLANAIMFGGLDSDSFKIKRKKLIQSGKKLKEIL